MIVVKLSVEDITDPTEILPHVSKNWNFAHPKKLDDRTFESEMENMLHWLQTAFAAIQAHRIAADRLKRVEQG